MTENERLTFETELGISIDKNEDCPTMSICWNCDIPPRKCNYFKDAIDKLAKYEAIGTIDEFKALKEKSVAKKPHSISIANDIGNSMVECPICHARSDYDVKSIKRGHCWKCGQKLDWSE